MYHEDGILVYLETGDDQIMEGAYLDGQDPANTERNDTRAKISAKLNMPFTVVLEFTDKFRPFSAEAIKLTVAIGHNKQTPEHLDDVQAWHIPLDQITQNRFTISQQWCWGDDSSEPVLNELRIPAPEAYQFDGMPNNDWADTYNAAKGCIAVYVVRGKFTGVTDLERKQFSTDPPKTLQAKAEKTFHPIRWEWFQELRPNGRSRTGDPYIFEFRNLEEVPEAQTADPESMLDDTEPLDENHDATYATLNTASDEDDSSEEDSNEGGSNEEHSSEDDSDDQDVDEDSSNEDDWDDGISDVFLDPIHFTQAARSKRVAQRGLHYSEDSDLPRHARPHAKRKRVVCSESRSPSTERPGRPSTKRRRPAALTSPNSNRNTSADVGRIAASASAHQPNILPGNPAPPIRQTTLQPTPVETLRLTPASEAGMTGTLPEALQEVPREVPRERALAKRQLELSKAKNRAAELKAHHRITTIQEEIDFETRFGDVLGE